MWEKEDGSDDGEAEVVKKGKKDKKGGSGGFDAELADLADKQFSDRYRMDPLLVRREATLMLLCLKSFRKRVIVFVNEKKQCGRLSSLFAFFRLKSVEVHGDLN